VPEPGTGPGPAGVRVLSWNLWWRFGDWERRQEAIAAVLTAERPDVCGLQEVWTGAEGSQADLLAEQLGMHVALSPSPAPRRWQQRIGDDTTGIANAVLSRWPITRHTSTPLPAATGRPAEHTVLHAHLDAPSGPLPFTTTQLESAPDRSATRCAQVREVARVVAASRVVGHPSVVTGDLNAEPDSDEVRLLCGSKTTPAAPGLVLVDAWRYADPADPGWTWDRRNPHVASTFEPSARIDHVLVGVPTAGGAGHVRSARLVGDRPVAGCWPSDHAGVLVELAAGS
jgi:endonuclease/exonuclease/phosphatase family metal-dependent hydrolase